MLLKRGMNVKDSPVVYVILYTFVNKLEKFSAKTMRELKMY